MDSTRSPPNDVPQRTRAAVRFVVAAATLALVAMLGGRAWIALHPPTREAWTLIAIGTDTSAFFARFSVSDTSFYRGQLTTRLALLPQNARVLEHRAMRGPAVVSDVGVASGTDALQRFADPDGGTAWDLQVGGNALQARIEIAFPETDAAACPPALGEATGTVQAAEDGTIVSGPAVLMRTRVEGVVRERALYGLGPGVAFAVDPANTCGAWADIAGERWAGTGPVVPAGSTGTVAIDRWKVTFKGAGPEVVLDAAGHLLPPERLLARALGWRAPRTRLQRVSLRVVGPGIDTPRTGLLVSRDTE